MKRSELIQELFTSNIIITNHITLLKKKYFSNSELNKAQFEILYILDSYTILSPTELATKTNTTSGAVTQIISGLIKLGYLEKITDSEDRRSIRISFTEQGKSKFSRIKMEHTLFWERMMASIDNTALYNAVKMQQEFLTNLENDLR